MLLFVRVFYQYITTADNFDIRLPRQLEFNNVSVFQCKYITVISFNEGRLLFCMERQLDQVKLQGTKPYAYYVIINIHVSAL